jgi:hypothetical protein
MYNADMIEHKGISVIQVRIIELTNQKINLESQLREVMNRIDLCDREFTKRELNKDKKILVGKIIEVEKILYLNKYLLNQTNQHEYQLEC